MKQISRLLCILGMVGSMNALADSPCRDNYGTLHCESGTISTVDYNGLVDIDSMTIVDSFNVVGNATILHSRLKNMQVRGDTHITRSSVTGSMHMVGNVNLADVDIQGSMKIVGHFYGKNARLNSTVSVIGNVDGEFFTFKNDVTFVGNVRLNNAEFFNSLMLNTKLGSFANTKLMDIFIKKPDDNEDQVIYLKNNSTVRNISFESQKGIVILSDNSHISGIVQGGKIIRKSN